MLTDTERAIALLTSDGLTNREIGNRLHLSPGTVRNYISISLQKLCITNRAQLASWAIRNDVKRTIALPIMPSDPDTYKDLIDIAYR